MLSPTPRPPPQPDTAVAVRQSISETPSSSLPTGFRDAFLERRYQDSAAIDVEALAEHGVLAFLAKATHIDEVYEISSNSRGLDAGLYRIRNEGSERPLLTLKRHGNGREQFSETVDVVHPDDTVLDRIRSEGTLLAVIEKLRVTYASKHHPHCLLHLDDVQGLGRFIDIKADSPRELDLFLTELGIPTHDEVAKSYLNLKRDRGVSPWQLKAWRVQQAFSDYILGVVSGTLTPLGFLTTTIASGGSKTAMILALLTAGLCDGLSDAVAASQTTQSDSRASTWKQVSLFTKTMIGKVAVPLTFVPCVLATSGGLATGIAAAAWAALTLGTTATIQAMAHERPVLPAVGKILAWGSGAIAIGTALGKFIPPLLSGIFQ